MCQRSLSKESEWNRRLKKWRVIRVAPWNQLPSQFVYQHAYQSQRYSPFISFWWKALKRVGSLRYCRGWLIGMVNQPIPSKDIVSQLSRLAFRVGLPIGTLQVSRPWKMAIRHFQGFSVVNMLSQKSPRTSQVLLSFRYPMLDHVDSTFWVYISP